MTRQKSFLLKAAVARHPNLLYGLGLISPWKYSDLVIRAREFGGGLPIRLSPGMPHGLTEENSSSIETVRKAMTYALA